mmetsp:Transcript_71373/g.187127  ORF Transcript_71373/g.187127 Transcript_71373/m.187127 type:complete len:277 (-) Transcript_71373:67-897(-)
MTGGAMLGLKGATATLLDKKKQAVKKKDLFLYFADVTEADLARAAAAETKAEVKRILKECMRIDQPEGFRTEILADMHYHNYSFCVSRDFSVEKTSTLLSVFKLVLEEAVRGRLEADAAFDVCKEWLLKHGVERPPWSVGVFSFDDIKAIMEYAHNTFFRHYRLYMYAFMTHCDLSFSVENPGVAPPSVRPLPLVAESEVDPRAQPELEHRFREQLAAEAAEAELRRRQEQQAIEEEDRAARIKRKIDEGVARLMDGFEKSLEEQDTRFQSQLDGN